MTEMRRRLSVFRFGTTVLLAAAFLLQAAGPGFAATLTKCERHVVLAAPVGSASAHAHHRGDPKAHHRAVANGGDRAGDQGTPERSAVVTNSAAGCDHCPPANCESHTGCASGAPALAASAGAARLFSRVIGLDRSLVSVPLSASHSPPDRPPTVLS